MYINLSRLDLHEVAFHSEDNCPRNIRALCFVVGQGFPTSGATFMSPVVWSQLVCKGLCPPPGILLFQLINFKVGGTTFSFKKKCINTSCTSFQCQQNSIKLAAMFSNAYNNLPLLHIVHVNN